MKYIAGKLVFAIGLLFISMAFVIRPAASGKKATYKWAGAWHFTRTSSGDGITELGTKIGRNTILPSNEAYGQAIYNVQNRFPVSKAWTTLAVGDLTRLEPTALSLTMERQESYLQYLDQSNVLVFIELFPFPGSDITAEISQWIEKYRHHPCIAGLGVELEYFGKATDSLTKTWDEKLKSYNAAYRLFLRHYNPDFMPATYRGQGDLIFIDDASESELKNLNEGFAAWANRFAPTACAFQIGYPADEDGMNGSKDLGWWRLKDPIKDWGESILPLIKDPSQELGLLWVTVKSGKSYNRKWDLTGGAVLPEIKKQN